MSFNKKWNSYDICIENSLVIAAPFILYLISFDCIPLFHTAIPVELDGLRGNLVRVQQYDEDQGRDTMDF